MIQFHAKPSTSKDPKDHDGFISCVSFAYLLLFRLWWRHILGEAFQGNLARVGRSFLRFVGCVLDESSLQQIIGFVAPILAFAPLDRSPKFERCAMDGLGGKGDLIAVELARFEKVIEKNAAIAFRVAVARNKAGNAALLFYTDLHEPAISQQTILASV